MIDDYKQFLHTRRDRLDTLINDKKRKESDLSSTSNRLDNLNEAKEVMNAVGILAQTEIKELIEELVTKALHGVFGEDYSFEIVNQVQRNKPETFFYINKNGVRRSLKSGADGSNGGSVAVLVATILRLVLWTIKNEPTRNTIVLDEPLKDSSKDKLQYLGDMLRQFNKMLDTQIILITHEEELMEFADKFFMVTQEKGISKIEETKL